MRHLLISAALLLAGPAYLAAPAGAQPSDPSQIRGKGGFGQYQQQQAAQNGGPTTFTNQAPQGQQPGPNGEPPRGDRGGDRRGQQAQPQPNQQQMTAPQGRDRDNWQGGNRDNRQGGNNGRYDNNRGNWDNNNRGWDNNRGRNDNYRGGSNGSRWSSYGNYHRDWRPTQRFRAPSYNRPRGWYSHRWTFGEMLPSLFWGRDYWLDYRMYDLPAPPYGAVWVRVGDDALLIDRDTGEVITVSYNVFY